MSRSAVAQDVKAEASLVILPFHVKVMNHELRLFINVQKVAKVFAYRPLTPFMDPLGIICGLYDDNGVPIPVIALRSLLLKQATADGGGFRLDDAPHSSLERIIVCSIMGHLVGFLVDRTKKIERWQHMELQPPLHLPGMKDDLIQAILRDEQGFRYMINVEHVLMQAGLHHVEVHEATSQALQGKRILLVEDSAFFMKLASQTLRNQGAEVVEAHNGQEGLNLLNLDDHFDLAIVDIEMPFVNGIDMVRRYKSEKADSKLRFLFHTSITNEALFRDLKAEQLGECLSKQSSDELLQTVKSMLTARAG